MAKQKTKASLPEFIVYHPNEREYLFCMETKTGYKCWTSLHAPSMDVRYPRKLKAHKTIKEKSRSKVWDTGTYGLTGAKTKEETIAAFEEKLNDGNLSFVLHGKKLEGRFALREEDDGLMLKKYKDKYAREEDLLSGDLSRSINSIAPGFDLASYKPKPRTKPKPHKRTAKTEKQEEPEEEEEEIIEEEAAAVQEEGQAEEEETVGPGKQIGKTNYNFTLYQSEGRPDICIIRNEDNECAVLERQKKKWVLLKSLSKTVLKHENEFIQHADALFE